MPPHAACDGKLGGKQPKPKLGRSTQSGNRQVCIIMDDKTKVSMGKGSQFGLFNVIVCKKTLLCRLERKCESVACDSVVGEALLSTNQPTNQPKTSPVSGCQVVLNVNITTLTLPANQLNYLDLERG